MIDVAAGIGENIRKDDSEVQKERLKGVPNAADA
jgi:hypothetical protein